MRNKAWRRHKDYSKAKRKRDIDRELQPIFNNEEGLHFWYWYGNLHQYSKNKIHCSCPLCAAKTNNKRGKRCVWAPAVNYSMADRKKQDRMTNDLNDYFSIDNQEIF